MSDLKLVLEAAEHMDWEQVVRNGGPPCFHLEERGRFCGRAKRWDGHDDIHEFVSLADLLAAAPRPDRSELRALVEKWRKDTVPLTRNVDEMLAFCADELEAVIERIKE